MKPFKVKIISCHRPWWWYVDKIGEIVEVVERSDGDYQIVDGSSRLIPQDCLVIGEKQMEAENASKLNINEAVLLLQSLLDFGYDPDVEIVLKHDSVRVNAFGKSFLVDTRKDEECSLENICKSVVLLSGAEL